MDADERHGVGRELPAHQREMHRAIDVILVAIHPKRTKLRVHRLLGNAFYRTFFLKTVADQVRDRADLQLVLLSKLLEIGTSGHRAVIVEYFYYHRCGLQPRKSSEIATRF